MLEWAAGFDVGATRVKAVATLADGQVLRQEVFPTQDGDPTPCLSGMRQLLAAWTGELGPRSRVGVAAPGLAAPDGRTILWMQGRMAWLEGLAWGEALGRERVPVVNDATASLLGEVWVGAAQGETDVLLLTLGTGVGGAAMVDGRILHGALGRAGHVGHISLNPAGPLDIVGTPGSLEDAVGEAGLSGRTGGRYATTHALLESNDPQAQAAWQAMVVHLAAGLVSLVNVLDPAVVLLGGGIAQSGERLLAPLAAELDRIEWRPHGHQVRLARTALGDQAGALGAARAAWEI